MAEVILSAVEKSFGETVVLKPTDLAVIDGEFVVLVGPSGSGKSTLLRLIAGLEEVSAGIIAIGGNDVTAASPSNRGIAMVFQSYALYPHLSVYENLAFALRLARLGKDEIDRRVRGAAEILAITDLLQRKPRALSGGQRQRVAIGRAIVREPKVFLFDEPLSNLDAALRVSMRYEFARLHKQLGTTMIYVTHDQVEAMTLADRIVVLANGGIEQIGTPLTLYEHPANLFVAGFIGSPKINLLAATVVEASTELAVLALPGGDRFEAAVDASSARVGDKVTLGIRPEQLRLADGPNSLGVEVRFVEELGGVTFAYVDAGETELTVQLPGGTHLTMGDKISLRADASSAYLFDANENAFARHGATQDRKTASASN